MEGKIKIKYDGSSIDLINTFLKNGYLITISITENNILEIIYYKSEKENF